MLDLDPFKLVSMGYRGIIVDLDNTLVPWNKHDWSLTIEDWWKRCTTAGLKGCIVTNNRFSGTIKEASIDLGIVAIANASKPRRGCFRKAMEEMGTTPSQTIVVGDQIFTDILGGNRLGVTTILVPPISYREFIGTMLLRNLERRLLSYFARKGMLRGLGD